MKHTILTVVAAFSMAAVPLCQAPTPGQKVAPATATPVADLVVHEWGTFTSMQGSDAVTLEGMFHEEEALPHFVYARSRDGGWREYLMKMETPVTYFYAPRAMTVRVSVDFPAGLLTQWFPSAPTVLPALPERVADTGKAVANAPPVLPQWGRVDWGDIEILPPGEKELARFLFPAETDKFTWCHARETDSNLLRTASKEVEKFLFYRGLGKFAAPLAVEGLGGDRVKLRAPGAHAARRVLLLQVAGERAGFTLVGDVAAGTAKDAAFPAAERPLDELVPELARTLAQQLVAEGLFAKEADAMVRTWSRQYFRTPGRRVLYVLDQELTDAVIPLNVEPKPKTTVRVMVARVECVAPEQEQEMVAWAHGLVAERASEREAAHARFVALGRFAEPKLRRTLALMENEPRTRRALHQLLAEVAPLR